MGRILLAGRHVPVARVQESKQRQNRDQQLIFAESALNVGLSFSICRMDDKLGDPRWSKTVLEVAKNSLLKVITICPNPPLRFGSYASSQAPPVT